MGQYDIHLDDKSIELRSRPAQSLLAYLLLNAGTTIRREKLCGILWPDTTETNARNNLRQALWRLQQALDLKASYILVDDSTITFDPIPNYWFDVAVLDHKGVESGPLEDLIDAVSVYKGELLPGFYEDWISLERNRLHAVFEQKMKVLMERLVGEKLWTEALDWGERWISFGQTPEPAYRALMTAHAALGDISAVAAIYKRCTDDLSKELGVEPSDQTRALYERLTKGEIRGYELRKHISTGELGSLYQAYHRLVGREVALKVISPEYANQPDFIRRFDAEAQLIARVEHPHILPLYDYWREPDGAYIVMRWMNGGSLRLLLRKSPLETDATIRLVDQISAALNAAHRQGLVHGHIKPENILFDNTGNAYLTHFGISNDVRRAGGHREPADSTHLTYLAPEQMRGEQANALSDQYSLGLVVYETLTGRSPRDLINTRTAGALPAQPGPHPRRPELPADVYAVINQATALNPAERYPDVMAFVAALHQVLGTGVATATGKADLPKVAITNPYKGLRAFQQADELDFFGRKALTGQLLARLKDPAPAGRFLAVVGPSGSGKSSVVKAGLLPALRRGALPGSEKWFMVEMSPGAQPLEELEIGLLRVAVNQPTGLMEQLRRDERGLLRATQMVLPGDNTELVLVVDQFEHIFAQGDDDGETTQFMNSLFAAVTDPASRLRVIITLRADFYDRPLLHPGLGSLLRQRTEVVMPLAGDELVRAIVGPAERVGITLEPGLVAAIVADVNEQPSALPLLQYALTELFERREGLRLTRKAYRSIGGVGGALARRAEEVYGGLDDAGQSATRQLFLRLVTLGEGVKDTRRRVSQSELTSIAFKPSAVVEDPVSQSDPPGSMDRAHLRPANAPGRQAEAMEAAIKAFGASRLLSFDRDPSTRTPTVEVAHSALLRGWRRLSDWLDASRVDLRMQHLLATAADEWLAANQESSFLLHGTQLAKFEGWADSTELLLTNHERTYLEASLAENQAQQIEETTRQKREHEAEKKLLIRNRVISVVVGMALILGILAGVILIRYMQQSRLGLSRQLAAQAMSQMSEQPDLACLLSIEAMNSYNTSEARRALFNCQNQYPQPQKNNPTHTGAVRNVVFSPDGEVLASASTDGTVFFWDKTGNPVNGPSLPPSDRITAFAISPDGKNLASAAGDIYLLPWQSPTGQPITFATHGNLVKSLAFSPDSKMLASGMADSTILLWDAGTGQMIGGHLEGHTDSVNSVTFSPDGKILASGSNDTNVILWDVATQKPVGKPLAGHSDLVNSVAFSPDGRKLASGSADNTILQWDVEKQVLNGNPLRGHTGYVFSVTYSPDGETLASASQDGTIRLWDSSINQALGQPLSSAEGALYGITFSPDGKTLVSGSQDGTVAFWDTDMPRRACEAASRNMTQTEWEQYLPKKRYQKTCPDLLENTAGTVEISVYSSKSKEDWMNAAAAAFNAKQVKISSGKSIVVNVADVNSGGSMQDIIDGKILPTVWSPGDQSWVDQINQIWRVRSGQPLIYGGCVDTVHDPIGIAMWRPMAEALGWPDQPISWDNLLALAADPRGWGIYGHPEWGSFTFGHTLPESSNSGLLFLTALAYDTLRPTGELTPDQVRSTPMKEALREVEKYTTVYGNQSEDLLMLMVDRGPAYLHAVTTNEAEVLKTNAKFGNLMPSQLVFIFPAQGTFWAQHPYCIVDAEWVTEEQNEAAKLFEGYLIAPEQQNLLVEKGLRPADPSIQLRSPIDLVNGTDPRITPATVPSPPSPNSALASAIKEIFNLAKRQDIPIAP